jgi:type VI secretion system protein ImpG
MPFNKYFEDELGYLREMGKEFALAYPALAPMLADRGGDPDVERLLEGVAFLTGRVREKLDDELPEFMLTVAQLLFPQLVRPLPASSILEFLPLANSLREARVVAAGAEVQSIPIDGTKCRFRTTNDCELAPIELREVGLVDTPGGRQELRLTLQLMQSGEIKRILPEALSLHFTGETRSGLALCAHLLQQVEEIVLQVSSEPDAPSVTLPAAALEHPGFEDEEALFPHVETAFVGFRLLQEYYQLPGKFSFVRVRGLRRASELGEFSQLSVIIRLKQRLSEVRRVTTEDVRLHCVPIVNVFETTAEPVRLDRRRERHLVRPAGLGVGQGDVYSIRKVTSVLRGGERVVFPPFLSFEHAAEQGSGSRIYYVQHLVSTVVGAGADTYLSLETAEDSGVIADAEVLSIDLLATNGPLANAVRAGEIREASPSSPPFATFRNLRAATTYVPPPLGQELQWRASAHAAMNLRALTEASVLRTALAVYNLHALVDRQVARANELRVESIREVHVAPAEKLYRGASVRGVDIRIDLDEAGFSGEGDIYLFGAVMERLFAEYVTINSFSRTSVRALGTNWEHQWPARSGSQTLL